MAQEELQEIRERQEAADVLIDNAQHFGHIAGHVHTALDDSNDDIPALLAEAERLQREREADSKCWCASFEWLGVREEEEQI